MLEARLTVVAAERSLRSSPHSTYARRMAPVLTAMSATLNVGQRMSPIPMSMKSTTPCGPRTRQDEQRGDGEHEEDPARVLAEVKAERGAPIVHQRQAHDVAKHFARNAAGIQVPHRDPLRQDVRQDHGEDDGPEDARAPRLRAFHLLPAACT